MVSKSVECLWRVWNSNCDFCWRLKGERVVEVLGVVEDLILAIWKWTVTHVSRG